MVPTRTVKIIKYHGKHPEMLEDQVVREVPFTLFVNDEELITLVCTPDSLEELTAGFLCSEGFLDRRDDLKNIKVNQSDGLIWAETAAAAAPVSDNFLKRYITTCCGKGRVSFYFINDARDLRPVASSDFRINIADVTSLSLGLEERANLFRSTGGAHGAALCCQDKLLAHFEDIGRHNAVDKILGYCFLREIPLFDKVIAISGRVSSEILIKAARMGMPAIISRSAPTDLALQMADLLGVTIAGFARGNRVNIYTHPERVIT